MQNADPELVESLHQFITAWRLIERPFPQIDGTDKPGLAISWPNTRFPFYNSIFLTRRLTDAHAARPFAGSGHQRHSPSTSGDVSASIEGVPLGYSTFKERVRDLGRQTIAA
jgi:hypothetical protein